MKRRGGASGGGGRSDTVSGVDAKRREARALLRFLGPLMGDLMVGVDTGDERDDRLQQTTREKHEYEKGR